MVVLDLGISWPTFVASGVLTLAVSLLTIFFGEPLRRWVNRNQPTKRRIDEQIQALDDYSSALRTAENACAAVGGGVHPPQNTPQKRVAAAQEQLCGLEGVIERLSNRLPEDMRARALDLALRVRKQTSTIAGQLAAAPPGFAEVVPLMPEIVSLGGDLTVERSSVERVRSKMVGHSR